MSEQPIPPTSQTPAVRSFKPLKPLDVALAELLATVTPCHDMEMVDLADADGRVLARDAVSALDVPGFDNSSMDGYAVCVAEAAAASEQGLPVSQRIPAGHFGAPLASETVARIFTGAPIPEHADAVVMQEECAVDELGRVTVVVPARVGQNIRRRGEDVGQGTCVVAAGTRLRPDQIGIRLAQGGARKGAGLGCVDLIAARRD